MVSYGVTQFSRYVFMSLHLTNSQLFFSIFIIFVNEHASKTYTRDTYVLSEILFTVRRSIIKKLIFRFYYNKNIIPTKVNLMFKFKTLLCVKNILKLLHHSTDPLSFESEYSLFFSKKI